MLIPLEMMDTFVGGGEERDRFEVCWVIRWRGVWAKVAFCATDKLYG